MMRCLPIQYDTPATHFAPIAELAPPPVLARDRAMGRRGARDGVGALGTPNHALTPIRCACPRLFDGGTR